MFFNKSSYKKRFRWLVPVLLLAVFMARCMYLDGIDMPSSAKAGETVDFVMRIRVEPNIGQTSKLIIAFLAPKSWKAAQNTTVSYTSSVGNGTMSLVPSNAIAANSNGLVWADALKSKYGIGGNLIDDVEWVVYQSNEEFSLAGNSKQTANVRIRTKLGPENMMVKLGFFLGNSTDGVTGDARYNKVQFTSCFSVTEGSGDLVDFCNPQLAVIDPSRATDNDFITINLDTDVVPTGLSGASKIYLCAKAYTSTGNTLEVCAQNEKALLKSSGTDRWRIDLWPRGYFNVPENETINKIEYYFMDASGAVKVGYGGTSDPFVYTFRCD